MLPLWTHHPVSHRMIQDEKDVFVNLKDADVCLSGIRN